VASVFTFGIPESRL